MSGERTVTISPHHTVPETIDVDGVPVAYRRKGTGPTTVFLHGAGSTRMWLPFYERMSLTVDFIAPEHPGFGDTPAPDWIDGFDDLVLHYHALFAALGLARIHLIGFSLGGWIAANLAIFYPERLKSLTLITPAGLRVPDAPATDLMRMAPEGIPDLLFNGRAGEHATARRRCSPAWPGTRATTTGSTTVSRACAARRSSSSRTRTA
jgi:pimeloyl-ACP methyl ester carboxylesterase